MKTFQLNPAATELELRIQLPVQMLETLGWDFEEYHENCASAKEISIEDARQYNYNSYEAVIKISGTPSEPKTLISWYSPSRNEDTGTEATGDDAQTIKDVISLLEDGFISIDNDADYSVDGDNNYVPSFISVEEEVNA